MTASGAPRRKIACAASMPLAKPIPASAASRKPMTAASGAPARSTPPGAEQHVVGHAERAQADDGPDDHVQGPVPGALEARGEEDLRHGERSTNLHAPTHAGRPLQWPQRPAAVKPRISTS